MKLIANCELRIANCFGWGMPGQYHWKLENPREITPIPYIGRLGIFEVPDDLVREVAA
ncbi:hypothetical protein GNF10_28270 [Nostoc sp. UCD121]|uniref:hypothetical protein n=1 Tax=unclassified Nostoc TaxID=2593658 RepID=UPI0016243F2E|nr:MULTISPECIES: hypothetical protein [unclassified Nostoc]MBC1220816.1 hypothetical protein [Nostoc sp. UCD120]MBC1279747.1 hypothetical protein [Nostoc sp. UCD121]MBC1295519.1 hypothetical protein [Nostoc sp. UCD122]